MSGGEIALLRLLPALTEVEPRVVLFEDGPFARRLEEAGIPVQVVPMNRAGLDLPRSSVTAGGIAQNMRAVAAAWSQVLRLRRLIRELRPDLVHTNSMKALVIGACAGRLAGIPVVAHVRDRVAPEYLPTIARRLVLTVLRRLCAVTVANSESTRATLGTVRARVLPSPVVYDPVVSRLVRKGDAVRAGDHVNYTFAMVGRISPWKGQDVFLRAFASAFPAGSERAMVVGGPLFGEFEYLDSLRRLVADLGIASRVEFTGHLEDTHSALARADAVVHASVIPEPFGMVVVEALGSGLPVIAADAGGPAEVIQDGVNGLLSPPGDEAALAERMRRLRDDPALVRRLVAAGRVRAEDFSPASAAAEMQRLYRDALGEARAR